MTARRVGLSWSGRWHLVVDGNDRHGKARAVCPPFAWVYLLPLPASEWPIFPVADGTKPGKVCKRCFVGQGLTFTDGTPEAFRVAYEAHWAGVS